LEENLIIYNPSKAFFSLSYTNVRGFGGKPCYYISMLLIICQNVLNKGVHSLKKKKKNKKE
jgi:hypothetical protein